MKLSPATLLRGLALFILIAAWAILAHYGSSGDGNADFSAAIATVPVLAIVVLLLWRVGHPLWIAVGGLPVLGLLAWSWPSLRQNVTLLFYVQHLGTNLALATLFGRTLFGGREALVTSFARLAQLGPMSPAKLRYTRQVTVAWTLFFLASVVVSSGLYWLAPAHAWSVFANLLSTPLLGLMFLAEHVVRNRVLPPEEHSTIADSIRGYRAAMQERRTHTLADHP
jgi:uncharacterized membrane protein